MALINFESEQQIFDIVAEHLLKQMNKSEKKCSSGNMLCLYRSPEGLKCAVGALIPDSLYKEEFDDQGAENGLDIGGMIIDYDLFDEKYRTILEELQKIHDNYAVEDWKRSLYFHAKRNNLEWKFGEVELE